MNDDTPKCTYEGCTRDIKSTELCIFHMPKKTAEEKEKLRLDQIASLERIENEFKVKFYKLLKDIHNDSKIDGFDFSGFQFPEIDISGDKLKEIIGLDEFNKPVSFYGATFSDGADFRWAKFSGVANFGNASFSGNTCFNNATFSDKANTANFLLAKFFGETDFSETFFSGKAKFTAATFSSLANFRKATFSDSDFLNATFSGKAEFIITTFCGGANFCGATFEKEAIFQGFGDEKCFREICDFSFLQLSKNARVEFQNVNLSKASFLDTDLKQLTFRDVDWHNPHKEELEQKNTPWQKVIHFFLPNREIALWDEFRELKKDEEERDYDKIAENYQQLILNYERKRNFEMVERFIACEMEIRRKRLVAGKMRSLEKSRELIGYNIYRSLSNYGTSYWRALCWMLLLLVGLSLTFFFSGFEVLAVAPGVDARTISYDVSGSDWAPITDIVADLCSTVAYALSVFSLQKSAHYQAAGEWSTALTAIARIFFYAQTALLLLAIRRRFRHK